MNIKELITKTIKDFEDFKEGNKAVIINEKTTVQEFGDLKPLLNERISKVFEEILNLRRNGIKTMLLFIPYDTKTSPFIIEPIDNEEQIKKVYDKYKRN